MNPADLRDYRATHDLTQAQLAVRLGRSLRQVSAYEAGAAPIPHWLEVLLWSQTICGNTTNRA